MTRSTLWQRVFARTAPAEGSRWVVIDVETSGLDPQRDRLLAVAAIAVRTGAATPVIDLGDSFEVVLRHEGAVAEKPNILLHGIGVGAQRGGVPAGDALAAFHAWLGDAPLLAFHAAFDRAMIERAMHAVPDLVMRNPWLDLEPVAALLHPEVRARALDEWLAHFDIECIVRHQAAADVLATAELLQRLWPAARAQRCTNFASLRKLAAQRRWLAGR